MTAALVVLFLVGGVLGLAGGALVWRHSLLRAAERKAVAARSAAARLTDRVSLARPEQAPART